MRGPAEPMLQRAGLEGALNEAVDRGILPPMPRRVLIVGGTAMLEHRMKKTTGDLDVVVDQEWYDESARRPDARVTYYGPDRDRGLVFFVRLPDTVSYDDDGAGRLRVGRRMRLDVLQPPNEREYSATFEELASDAVLINGVLVLSPIKLLMWKQALGREKDKRDVRLIVSWLRRRSVERSVARGTRTRRSV